MGARDCCDRRRYGRAQEGLNAGRDRVWEGMFSGTNVTSAMSGTDRTGSSGRSGFPGRGSLASGDDWTDAARPRAATCIREFSDAQSAATGIECAGANVCSGRPARQRARSCRAAQRSAAQTSAGTLRVRQIARTVGFELRFPRRRGATVPIAARSPSAFGWWERSSQKRWAVPATDNAV
jgi:hypothetical protein